MTVEVKVEVYAREHPQSCARDSEAGARKGGEKGRGDREGRKGGEEGVCAGMRVVSCVCFTCAHGTSLESRSSRSRPLGTVIQLHVLHAARVSYDDTKLIYLERIFFFWNCS